MRYFHPAKSNELQCDLDNKRDHKAFRAGIKMLRSSKHVKIIKIVTRSSSTTGHRHGIIILSKPLPVLDRIILQLCLGDDRIRGLMNWGRVKNNDPHPIILIDNRPSALSCNCDNTKKLPRCIHVRSLQSSHAEFHSR